MHELGIAINIIRIVEGEMASRGIDSPVERVSVRIGKMRAVIPASLKFHFDVAKRDNEKLKHASLDIEDIRVKASCSGCNREFEISEPFFACEECGGAVRIVEGEEMIVESIAV